MNHKLMTKLLKLDDKKRDASNDLDRALKDAFPEGKRVGVIFKRNQIVPSPAVVLRDAWGGTIAVRMEKATGKYTKVQHVHHVHWKQIREN